MGFDKHFKIYKENWQIIQVNLAALNKEINDEKQKLDYIAKNPTYSELPVTRTPDNSNFYYFELFSSVP